MKMIDVDGVQRPTTDSRGRQIAPTHEGLLAFWRNFGESKATHWQTGQPELVFHGTAALFDKFEYFGPDAAMHHDCEVGDAFYFSNDPATASWYATDCAGRPERAGMAHVLPVYLCMNNPRIVNFKGTGVEYLADEIERAKEDGNDGLIAYEYDDGGVSDHYIVFKPEQIKSAVGNPGSFDVSDPRMTDGHEIKPGMRLELAVGAEMGPEEDIFAEPITRRSMRP